MSSLTDGTFNDFTGSYLIDCRFHPIRGMVAIIFRLLYEPPLVVLIICLMLQLSHAHYIDFSKLSTTEWLNNCLVENH